MLLAGVTPDAAADDQANDDGSQPASQPSKRPRRSNNTIEMHAGGPLKDADKSGYCCDGRQPGSQAKSGYDDDELTMPGAETEDGCNDGGRASHWPQIDRRCEIAIGVAIRP